MADDLPIHCHDTDPHAARFGPPKWQTRAGGERPGETGLRHCSYCGSLHPLDLLTVEVTNLHRADMKYGYPHKFYLDVPNTREGDLVRVGGLMTGQRPVVHDGQVMAAYDAQRAGHGYASQASDEQLLASGWEIETTTTVVTARSTAGEREKRRHEQITYTRPRYELGRSTAFAKFYSAHLQDLADEDFTRVADLLRTAGVDFVREGDGRTKWRLIGADRG